VNVAIKLLHAPVERNAVAVVIPITVQPNGTHFSVVVEQFAYLSLHKVEVSAIVWLQFSASIEPRPADGIVLAYPVENGIIYVQVYVLFVAGIGKLFQYIAFEGCCIYDVVVAFLCFEH